MTYRTDQTGHTLTLPDLPKRIISLVPSQTELLYDLGLDEEVAGITKFCVHPAHWFHNKTRIGGTKNLNLERIRELQPDLILANREENVKEQVEELARDFPVWTSDISDLEQALSMIAAIGQMTGREEKAREICENIRNEFDLLARYQRNPDPANGPKTCYLIWRSPWMTVGHDTFIHDMLTRAGFRNVFAGRDRYPETSLEELKEMGCEYVLLSSEPYPFREKHIEEIRALLPRAKVLLVDGEMFSWYGSRLVKAGRYLGKLRE